MEQIMTYIEKIYSSGSFTEAAKQLYVTTPALSIAVKKEEQRIGMPIFERSRHPIELTEAGKLYLENIKKQQLAEMELKLALNDIASLNHGILRIGGSQYVNSFIIADVLSEFIMRYPLIEISMSEGSSDEMMKALQDGKIDITFSTNAGECRSFNAEPAFDDTILLAVPSGMAINRKLAKYRFTYQQIIAGEYINEKRRSLPLNLIADMPMILLTERNNLYRMAMDIGKAGNFAPEIILQVEQLVTSYHLSCSGIGASLVSDLIVKHNLPGGVFYYKLPSQMTARQFYAVTDKRRYIPKTVKLFMQIFKEQYRK